MIKVDKLKKGVVIDHIQEGKGMDIFNELHLNDIGMPVVLMKGVPSEKMGAKDLIKIETDLDINMDILGLIDPNITVNFVSNGKLERKQKLTLPTKVTGILECHNPRCISQHENVGEIEFYLVDEENKVYRCEYCDSYTTFDNKK